MAVGEGEGEEEEEAEAEDDVEMGWMAMVGYSFSVVVDCLSTARKEEGGGEAVGMNKSRRRGSERPRERGVCDKKNESVGNKVERGE